MDMSRGNLLPQIIRYTIPLMLSGVLQLLFNAADIVVVGQFAGKDSMAAVGATSALINLLVNLFIGLSIGTNVLAARFFGSHKDRDMEETVHTSMLVAGVGGVVLLVIGILLARPLLVLMDTPDNVLPLSTLYMRIYFAGMPAMLIYNYGGAILRAVGDTRHPLYYLTTAGVINVGLNLFFVIVLHLDVAGVALATTLSQCISSFLIIRCLMRVDAAYRLDLHRLRIVRDKFVSLLRIGIPAGLQGIVFSLSNVLIQSSVNSFGSSVMAGNTAAANLEGFVYVAMNSFYQSCLSFTSQNYGARNFKRMTRTLLCCLGMVTIVGLVLGLAVTYFGRPLLSIYNRDPEVISYGMRRLRIICAPYFLCGVMEVFVGGLRGMGRSVMPMLVALTGSCALRIVWIYTVFAYYGTLESLYISYPISWALTAAVHALCYIGVRRRIARQMKKAAG